MENLYQLLKDSYSSFIDEESELAFFTGLSDYMQILLDAKEFKPTLDNLLKERDTLSKELSNKDESTTKKLLDVYKKIQTIINENEIDNEEIEKNIRIIDKIVRGELQPPPSKCEYLYGCLLNICYLIDDLGFNELIKEYLTVHNKEMKIRDVSFRKLIQDFKLLRENFEVTEKTSIWGALSKLLLVNKDITQGKVKFKESHSNPLFSVKVMNYGNINEYKTYAKRVHLYLCKKLTLNKNSINEKIRELELMLDEKAGKIYIKGNKDNFWSCKTKGGRVKDSGEIAIRLFKERGKAILTEKRDIDNYRSLRNSLCKKFELTDKEFEERFYLAEHDAYGLKI